MTTTELIVEAAEPACAAELQDLEGAAMDAAVRQLETLTDALVRRLPGLLDDLDQQARVIADLRGQRTVLWLLLRDAADVLHTVEGDGDDEATRLAELRQRIADACAGVALEVVGEAQG